MDEVTTEIKKSENVVQNKPVFSYGVLNRERASTTRKITRIADPHIEPYKVGDRKQVYYRYRRGTDKPIHLGTADTILRAVQATKLTTAKKPGSLFTD